MQLVPDPPKRPRQPSKLGVAGRKLWADSWASYWPEEYEIPLLVQACRLADTITNLEAQLAKDGLMIAGSKGQERLHPAVTELRQSRLAMSRLLGQIAFPSDDEEQRPVVRGRARARKRATKPGGALTAAQRNKVKAARARWGSSSGAAS